MKKNKRNVPFARFSIPILQRARRVAPPSVARHGVRKDPAGRLGDLLPRAAGRAASVSGRAPRLMAREGRTLLGVPF
jgi:hypothetical protein